jgi:hypothetical protein
VVLSSAALASSGRGRGRRLRGHDPEGDLADVNDTSWYLQARTVAAKKILGWRAELYYADTTAHGPVDGGRAFGFDVDAVARFGGRQTFGYAFAGAGYGKATFSRPGDLPGSVVRSTEWDWTMQGGLGVVIKKVVYLEAMYVQYQTNPKSAYIPVVIGFQY